MDIRKHGREEHAEVTGDDSFIATAILPDFAGVPGAWGRGAHKKRASIGEWMPLVGLFTG
ncbi:MAG TPA: hypothetical protein DDX19_01655 [Rhodopirellula baltica]|nr:hypothetical protein [Rhodopirellula baltica]